MPRAPPPMVRALIDRGTGLARPLEHTDLIKPASLTRAGKSGAIALLSAVQPSLNSGLAHAAPALISIVRLVPTLLVEDICGGGAALSRWLRDWSALR